MAGATITANELLFKAPDLVVLVPVHSSGVGFDPILVYQLSKTLLLAVIEFEDLGDDANSAVNSSDSRAFGTT